MATETPIPGATEPTKVTLHWLEKSRAQSFAWLLEECSNIDLEIKTYKRTQKKTAPDELKKVYPLGKSPVVQIWAPGRETPITIAESGAIAEYLCDHFAEHLVPAKWTAGQEGKVGGESEEWMRYRYFMHYCEGSLMSLMVSRVIVQAMTNNDQIPWLVKPITRKLSAAIDGVYFDPNFKAHFTLLEGQLGSAPGGGEFLCGPRLTAADIVMSFGLMACSKRGLLDAATYPKLAAYVIRLGEIEGYKRAVTRIEKQTGEPYVVA